jgi:hypothetical protein
MNEHGTKRSVTTLAPVDFRGTARRAQPGERDAVLEAVLDAFVEDPMVRWWFPDDHAYRDQAGALFGFLIDSRLAGGEVWTAPGVPAASLWVPPGGNLLGASCLGAWYDRVLASLPEKSAHRLRVADAALQKCLEGLGPKHPFWYLGVLVTRPECRKQGWAAEVLAPILAGADRMGSRVVLDTSVAANVAYYQRYGFSVLMHVDLSQQDEVTSSDLPAPMMWIMKREVSGCQAT